ncbi:Uncharacterised protein g7242 [Pycnogonum litorale]
MFLQKAMRYYRLWIYTCNASLLLSVIVFISTTIWILSDPKISLVPGVRLYHPSFIYAYIALFVQGGILQAIGCIGALKLNEKLLNLYWNLMLFLLFGDVVVGIVWIFRFDKINDSLRSELKIKLQSEYGTRANLVEIWNGIQNENSCCGVDGPTDYMNISKWRKDVDVIKDGDQLFLPASCCPQNRDGSHEDAEVCEFTDDQSKVINRIGCLDAVRRWIRLRADVLFTLGYCVIAFLKFCFLGILKYEIREMIQKIKMINGAGNGETLNVANSRYCSMTSQNVVGDRDQPRRGNSTTSINTVRVADILPLHHSSPVINSSAVNQQSNHVIPTLAQLGNCHNNPRKMIDLKTVNGNNNDMEMREIRQES